MHNRIIFCLCVLGAFDTSAAAQSLVADQTTLSISTEAGTTKLAVVNVTSSGAALTGITVSATTTSGGP